MSTALLNPFWLLGSPSDALKAENDSLRKIVAAQESRIDALTKLIDLAAVETLIAENADLHRLLALRGEVVSLEQQIEERQG